MKKRILLTALALILVCALSIMGTVAYLQDSTKDAPVVNTFIAAGGPGPFVDEQDGVKQFALKEYKVTQASSGKYTEDESVEVLENTYNVMPGTTIPKHAFVKLSRTGKQVTTDGETTVIAPAPAYMYIEVVGELPAQYVWSIDAANWTQLMVNADTALVGPNNGKVYQYTGKHADSTNVVTTVAANTKIDIITNDEITVTDNALAAGEITLTFYAYLAQASTGESDAPIDVFNACFKAPATPDPEG